ncbi:diguanylate cyclase [Candidatus Bipolaricaulota bacterium]|nr:diguanylate cyclase [Candidatus Bipolaricaulota bacterium]
MLHRGHMIAEDRRRAAIALAVLVTIAFVLVTSCYQVGFAGTADWLTQEERDWISAHPAITAAPDPAFPPIEYFNENGEYRGLAADYLALIAQETGLTFKVVRCKSWDEALQKAENHEVDALPAAGQTENRAQHLLFSDPLLVFPGVIITRQEVDRNLMLADLTQMRVAVVRGYLWQEFMARDHPEILLDLVPDVATGLRKVSLGMADAMVATLPIAIYYIEQDAITNLRVAGETGYFTRLSFASRNDWPQLNVIVQKALSHIPKSDKDAILGKWIDLKNGWHMSPLTFWFMIGIPSLLIAAGMGFALWTISLKHQIARRTETLQASERRYRSLFEELSDALFLETLDGRILDVNDSACKLLGYTRDELLALTVPALLPENAPAYGPQQMAQMKFEDAPLETVNKHKNGTLVPVEIRGTTIDIEGEQHLLISLRDISARVRERDIKRVLHRISEAANKAGNLSELFPEIRRILAQVIDTANFRVALYDSATDKIAMEYLVDQYDRYASYVAGKTLTAYVIKEDQSLLLKPEEKKKWISSHGLEPVGRLSKIWLGVPMHAEGDVIGAVVVQSYENGSLYSEADVSLLELVADQIGAAIMRRQAQDALRESGEQFRTVFDATTDAVLLFTIDGEITYANIAACKMYGYEREELIGLSAAKLIDPNYFHGFANFRRAIDEEKRFVAKSVNVKKNGEAFDVEIHGAGFTHNNKPYLVSITLDISEQLAAERALEETKRKVEELHNVAQSLEASTREEDVYRATVGAAEKILSFSMCTLDIVQGDKLVPKGFSSELPAGATQERTLADGGLAAETYKTGKTTVFGSLSEVPEARPTREDFRSGISAPIGKIGVFQVVSTQENAFSQQDVHLLELLLGYTAQAIARIRLQKQLRNQAMRDPLTNVYNRRYFNQVIEREIGRSKRYDHPIGFLMIDVDHFKHINDTYGHQIGDRVLQGVADLLVEQVRDTDLVVRYGGDEFLLVLIETNGETETIMDRIRAAVAERNKTNELVPFPVTLSVGSAHWSPKLDQTAEEILAEADAKMYEAKRKQNGDSISS